MAKEKKVEQITDMEQDFAQWFTDVCTKAELVDYSGVKGLFIMRPYGYAIWENIQSVLDKKFKEHGHENVSMPMLIPESLLQKEKDHVEGFAPECAWVTMGGSEELTERLCIRPTSETLFCDHWSHLRGREFLWQEGHTLHATEEEARKETLQQLEVYADVCENYLAMPVIRGNKTEKEKFAGAVNTYTIECMMHDHKALQSGTSHYFGTGFAEQLGIMTHGDNNGLVLPPEIAPIQVIVVPVAQHKPGVTEKATELYETIKAAGVRVKIDVSDNSLGWKCAQYEMKGVPLRIEIGPRDIENGMCMAVRRDNGEKIPVSLDEIGEKIHELLKVVQQGLFDKAKKNLDEHIFEAHSLEEAKRLQEEKGGFIKTMWCGELECEMKMKEQAGMTSRCIPFAQEDLGDTCPICGKKAKHMIYWGVAY